MPVSVGRLLAQLGLTCQRPLYVAYEQNPSLVEQWLAEEYPRIRAEARRIGAEIYFGAEAGVRSDGHAGTTWSLRGQTPIVMTTGQRFGLNMLSAVSAKGLLRFMVTQGRVGGQQVCEFLRRLMYRAKRPTFLILDGHPMHKSRLVKQCEQSFGGKLKLFFLPPYSPELSTGGESPPGIPMVFLKLVVQRADEVLPDGESASRGSDPQPLLPQHIGDLVDAYLGNLLENAADARGEAQRARRAALACVGEDGRPSWRPIAAYEQKGLKLDAENNVLLTSCLMISDVTDVGDPLFKFSLDPIAEYLAAKELVLAVRDGKLERIELERTLAGFSGESDVPTWVKRIGRALYVKVE